jgi:hypothetical protein
MTIPPPFSTCPQLTQLEKGTLITVLPIFLSPSEVFQREFSLQEEMIKGVYIYIYTKIISAAFGLIRLSIGIYRKNAQYQVLQPEDRSRRAM